MRKVLDVQALVTLRALSSDLRELDLSYQLPEALKLVAERAEEALPGCRCSFAPDGEPRVEGLRPAERPLFALFAEQARTAARTARTLADRGRLEEDLLRLVRSAELISARQGLEETLRSILRMALDVTGARYGIFRLMEGGKLVTRALEGLERPLVEALDPLPTSITGWVAHHRQAVCIADLRESPWRELYYPLDEGHDMRSEVAAPLLGGSGRLEGVLNLESPEVGAFGDADARLLVALAGQAVIALQQVRLLDALQEVAERLLDWDCARVLGRLVELVGDLSEAAGAAIYEGDDLRACWGDRVGPSLQVEIGSQGAFWAFFREPPGEWERKVLGCLAHHADLALQGEAREVQLRETEERQALAETFAALGDLSANLMHQLNNKLGVIPVRVQGILDRCQLEDPYLVRNLGEIERSAQAAMKVVRESLQILEVSGEGRFALAQLLEQALEEVQPPPQVQVQLAGLEGLPPVAGGQRGLVLIFTNLLENAVRIMGGPGLIRIVGSRRGEWTQVDVEDSGPGVAPELHERIFEFSFSQGSGLGFGLWWVRTLMVRLGGSISVHSDGQRGARFRLRFP